MVEDELYFEDVELGTDLGPIERSVTDRQVVDYVKIGKMRSGPSRFTDADSAMQEDLPGPIVPGAIIVALMSQLLTGWSRTVRLKTLDVVFRQVVQHNVPLQLIGVVTDKNVVDGEPLIDCDVILEGDDGTSLVIGTATVSVPMKQLPRH